MAARPELRTRTGTTLALTPALRQRLDLLRMTPRELLDRIQAETETNPFLLVEDRGSRGAAGTAHWSDAAARLPAQPETLAEHLRAQIALTGLDAAAREVADYLCNCLDERGFLQYSRAEIAFDLQRDVAVVDRAIEAVRACDPPGVGARSLHDCLALQLQRRGVEAEQAFRILGALEPLMAGQWDRARRALGAEADVEGIARMLRGLDPTPGGRFHSDPVQPVLADLRVVVDPGLGLAVELMDGWLPRLAVDEELYGRTRSDPRGRVYADERRRAAEMLIGATASRGRTLLRIGHALAEAQADYFLGRRTTPVALTRAALAGRVGLHPSTLGRALRGSALEFGGRVILLEALFPTPIQRVDGTEISSDELRQRIRRIVAGEAVGAAHSDEEIARMLNDEGVDITRRTVAKYRRCMKIPSSHVRRRPAFRP